MKRIWGPLIMLATGLSPVAPAMGEEDLFQVPTVSPPTASSQGAAQPGYAPYGYAPPAPAGPYGYGPPPVQPNYASPMFRHQLPPGPFGEPLPDNVGHVHGHRAYRGGGCANGNCGDGGCNDGSCDSSRTCWYNDQYEPEWYVAAMLGFQQPRDMQIDYEGLNLRMSPDGGWTGSAAAGWASGLNDLGRHRFEVEFNVRSSDVDRLTYVTQPLFMEGDVSTIALMANLYWDFKRPGRNWYPYIGAGFGGAHFNFEQHNPTLFGGNEIEDEVYAWQLMAGLSIRPKPWIEFFAEAKYFSTDTIEAEASIPNDIILPGPVQQAAGQRNFRAGYHSAGTMIGFRLLLGKRACDTPAYDGRPTSGGGGWHLQPYHN